MDIDAIVKGIKGLSPVAAILIIYILFTTNIILFFIPLFLWILAYFIGRAISDSQFIAGVIGLAMATFIMSFISLLVNYFPDSIGTGLFADGFALASVVTISNGVDLLFYAQTIQWGIVFDWVVVSVGLLVFVGAIIINRSNG